jgi:hypothetical protein
MAQHRLRATTGLAILIGATLCAGSTHAAFKSRFAHTATLLPDRNTIVIGGTEGAGVSLSTAQLVVATVTVDMANMSIRRASHTATLLPNGEVLVAGGVCAGSGVSAYCNADGVATSLEVFNPIYNCWHSPIVATGRHSHTAVLISSSGPAGGVLLCGGFDGTYSGADPNVLGACDIFTPVKVTASDPSNGACAPAPGSIAFIGNTMRQGRALHTATMLPDGRIFFAGGYNRQATPNPFTTTTEIFEPVGFTFRSAYPLSQGRAYHQATLNGDGKVLITGGFDGYDALDNGDTVSEPFPSRNRGVLRSVELYDPVADHTAYIGLSPERRMMHTTTLMGDGGITMLGGIGNITNSYRKPAVDNIQTGTVTLNCATLPCTVIGTDLRTSPTTCPPKPYQLKSPYRQASQGLPEAYSDLAGTFKEAYEYYTMDPDDNEALPPYIPFSAGTINLSSANPVAEVGIVSSLSGTNVYYDIDEQSAGWVDRTKAPYVNVINGAGTVTFSPITVNLGPPAAQAGSSLSFGAFPIPGVQGQHRDLTGGTLNLDITLTGLPPELVTANISITNLELYNGEILYYVSGDEMLKFTLAKIVAAGPLAGTVTRDNSTDPPTVQVSFVNAAFTVPSLPGSNIVTLSSSPATPPVSPINVSGLTFEKSMTGLIKSDNLRADKLVVGQAQNPTMLVTDLAVTVVKSMVFSGITKYSRNQPANQAWWYSLVGSGVNQSYGHTATLLPNSNILTLGGQDCDPAFENASCPTIPMGRTGVTTLSPDSFQPNSNLMTSRRGNHTATLIPDGKILVAGGTNGGVILNDSELFDPALKTFTPTKGSMHDPRNLHTATLLPNGRVLVTGGWSTSATSTGAIAGAEVYFPDTQLWTSTSVMSSARSNHAAVLLPNGNVMVVGGYANGNFLNTAEIYYSTAQVWRPLSPMAQGRSQHTATLLQDGRVLVTGGGGVGGVSNTYEIYDPNLNQWTVYALLPLAVRMHTATLLADGRVIVAGGNDGHWEQDSFLIFNPKQNYPNGQWTYRDWINSSGLWWPRQSHTATLLPNGSILAIGGAQAAAHGGQSISQVDIFTPSNDSWGAWGNLGGTPPKLSYIDKYGVRHVAQCLSTRRAYHTATLAPDGTVWVIGGYDGSLYLNSSESHFYMGSPDAVSLLQPSTRLSTVTATDLPVFDRGERLNVYGQRFLNVTEASGGGAGSGNSDHRHPIWILQGVDGSGGTSSQGNSGFMLDLTTRIYQNSANTTWDLADSSLTVRLPDTSGSWPAAGAEGYFLPYGWYQLRVGANDQLSPSHLVHAGPHLPAEPVTNLTAYDPATTYPAGVGTSSVTFTWNTPAGLVAGTDFDGYNVYIASTGVWISTRPDTQGALGYNFIKLDDMPASSAQGLIVQPYNISGDHPTLIYSTVAYTLPLEPTHVVLATAPGNSFYVKWDTYSVETGTGNFAGTLYEVSQSTDANFDPILTTFPLTDGDFAPAQPLQLTPNTRYYFRVRACNLRSSPYGECSAYGLDRDNLANRYVSTQTLTAVTGLYGVSYATDTVNWYWTAAGGGALYRVVNGTVAAASADYVIANNVSTNSYSQTGLLQNQRSVIQVQVQDGGVVGPLSVPATAYSLAMAPVWNANSCPASGGSPTEITTGSVVVEWNTLPGGPNSGGAGPESNATTYEVQYATGNWDRTTGNWNPGVRWRDASVVNNSPAVTSHKLILENINHGVSLYVRARALNTDGKYLDRAVNPNFADPRINPNGGWINLISNVDDNAYTSTLQRPPTALMVIDPKGPTSATLWWMDRDQWEPDPARLGFPRYNFQVVMTTCAWYEGPSLVVDFNHSSGPYCGVTPSGADTADLPFNTNTALIANLNTWSTYYFTLNSYNLPHYDNNVSNVVSSIPVQAAPPYAYYYTSVPGAVAGSLVIDVSARYGGSISSASVGIEAPGQAQHTVSFYAPPEAFPVDTRITISTFSVANDPRLALCPGTGGPGGTLCGGDNNLAFEITADPAVQPKLPLFFTVNYKSGEPVIAGLTDPKEALLLRFDPLSCKCVPVRSPTAPTSQSITGQLNHLSIFQVGTVRAGSTPETMRIYPNPYYAARDGWLTIDGLPAYSRVRLFTLRGEMVLDTAADSHGIFTWQGTNRGGRLVASGVYLVVVEGNGIKAIRKLVLLK